MYPLSQLSTLSANSSAVVTKLVRINYLRTIILYQMLPGNIYSPRFEELESGSGRVQVRS